MKTEFPYQDHTLRETRSKVRNLSLLKPRKEHNRFGKKKWLAINNTQFRPLKYDFRYRTSLHRPCGSWELRACRRTEPWKAGYRIKKQKELGLLSLEKRTLKTIFFQQEAQSFFPFDEKDNQFFMVLPSPFFPHT